MIRNCSRELKEGKSLPYVQNEEELRKNDYDSINKLLFNFLDHMHNTYK